MKLSTSPLPSILPLALLMASIPALAKDSWADHWTYFHPEAVTKFSCTVLPVSMAIGRDANEYRDMYEAEAHAERGWNLGQWVMTLDFFPATPKGRKRALMMCSHWMDEAESRVKAAAPIHVNAPKGGAPSDHAHADNEDSHP